MSSRADQLAHKRRLLRRRIEWQRREVAELTTNIEARLAGIDRLLSNIGRAAKNPLIPIAAIAAIMLIGPWRLLRWAGQGLIAFNVARRVRNMMTA